MAGEDEIDQEYDYESEMDAMDPYWREDDRNID